MDDQTVDISKDTPRDMLLKYGDLLEKEMFSDDVFYQEFKVYGEIWARYILQNRERKSSAFTLEQWREFAQFH